MEVKHVFLNLARIVPEEGDFFDEDGYLICGKCRTRKSDVVTVPESISADGRLRVPVLCKCEEGEINRRNAAIRRQAAEKKAVRCGLDPDATFGNNREQSRAVEICRRYTKNLDEMMRQNIGILLHGTVGSGKTFLAQCVGNAAVRLGKGVLFQRVADLGVSRDAIPALIQRVTACDLLVLDDIGVQSDSSFSGEVLGNVIDARYLTGKPMIATSNISVREMKSCQDITYRRIYDRLLEMCPMQIEMRGASRRGEIEREKRRKAMQLLAEVKHEDHH